MKKVIAFVTKDGKRPFKDWLESLDRKVKVKAYRYIDRVAMGGSKNSVKPLKDGVFEIKIDTGPGYRIYFGEDGDKIIVLLVGGTKRNQQKDIDKAKEYWREYGEST